MQSRIRLKFAVAFFIALLMGACLAWGTLGLVARWEGALGITLLVAPFIGVGVGAFLAKRLSDKLQALSEFSARVAGGDLSAEVDFGRPSLLPDEVDAVEGAVNHMLGNLRELVTQMHTTASSMAAGATDLSTTAAAVRTSSDEVTNSMDHISAGAELQSRLVDRARSLISEIATGIQRTAAAAYDAEAAAKETALVAQSGREVGTMAIDKLHKVFEKIEDTGGLVLRFGDKSKEISKIVEFITKLSQQTNLLALNASIEAARAGDYGRGFAVVADEIRKLAENSAHSTEQISKLIDESVGEAARAVDAVRESTEELSRGREDMSSIIQSLDNISVTAQTAADTVSQISHTTRDQLAGAQEMVTAIENLHDVARANAMATDQVKNATSKQGETVQLLSERAVGMTLMSAEIKASATHFGLEKEASPVEGDTAVAQAVQPGETA